MIQNLQTIYKLNMKAEGKGFEGGYFGKSIDRGSIVL